MYVGIIDGKQAFVIRDIAGRMSIEVFDHNYFSALASLVGCWVTLNP